MRVLSQSELTQPTGAGTREALMAGTAVCAGMMIGGFIGAHLGSHAGDYLLPPDGWTHPFSTWLGDLYVNYRYGVYGIDSVNTAKLGLCGAYLGGIAGAILYGAFL